MNSRPIAQSLFLLAGIAILLLLIVPAVHVPFVVVHGPLTALRAQRAASLVSFLLRAAAFMFLGFVLPLMTVLYKAAFCTPRSAHVDRFAIKSSLRC